MAEALLKEKAADVEVKSAGLFATAGAPVSQQAVNVLSAKGITLDQTSTPLDDELIAWADLILTMTTNHKHLVLSHYPESEGKVYTLGEYGTLKGPSYERLQQLRDEIQEMQQRLRQSEGMEDRETEDILHWIGDKKEELKDLEAQLEQTNISDPFGGSEDVYRSICDEIDAHIDALLSTLKHQ